MNNNPQWSSYDVAELLERFQVDAKRGLSASQVKARIEEYGRNTFSPEKGNRFLRIVIKQTQNPLVLILFIAGVATLFLEAYVDAAVITAALLINIAVDVFQRGRASKAFQKLKDSQKKYAFVLRDGNKQKVPAEELIPGDIIFLDAGVSVPADARLLTGTSLRLNEAALTGEWMGVLKDAQQKIVKGPISEQVNMVWMGTLVESGAGTAVVVETGERTQLGSIAESLKGVSEEDTPLQRNIRKLGRFIALVVLGVIALLTIIGVVAGNSIGEMLLVAVAIAVAAIPEGLPAALTVVLALGMERILKKSGLVRNLLAAETLGSTTIILTDKTGTLTQAKMQVRSIATRTHLVEEKERSNESVFMPHDEDEKRVLAMAVRASDAFIENANDEDTVPKVEGRPVEKAIVEAGLDAELNQNTLLQEAPQVFFMPFSSARAMSLSVHRQPDEKEAEIVVVGAPEKILGYSKKMLKEGKETALTNQAYEEFVAFQEKVSQEGARLVAVGFKDVSAGEITEVLVDKEIEAGIVFGGFIVLDDPVRLDVEKSITIAQNSGIRVVMVTGDHPATALRIASLVGIAQSDERVCTGSRIETLDDKELLEEIRNVSVFARVLPAQKLRIAQLLKGDNEVVAMTGDGINDAPALRSADIGIALGSGTDVAKEASDIILLNNGFDIIVYAIEEGRRIIDNLKKITAYLLSTGFSEIALVGGALLAGAPLPLLPAQILWVNIISEGFMNFAFAFEPKERDIMRRDPRVVKSIILTPKLKQLILIIGSISGIFLIALYFILLSFDLSIEEVRTFMFAALSAVSIFFSFSLKNIHEPIWKINLFSNKYLLGALLISFVFLFGALLLPPLQTLLSLLPFSAPLFGLMILFGLLNLFVIEIAKHFIFKKE